jgi:hypothetical protein
MDRRLWGYALRFILLHVLTYTAAGIIFYQLQDYAEAFQTMEAFELFRPLDDPFVAAAMPIQIVRGALLALLLYPFYDAFTRRKHGWLLAFGVLYGFTAIGSAIFIPDLVETIVVERTAAHLVVGVPEITVQMLLFSWLFVAWERRRIRKAAG